MWTGFERGLHEIWIKLTLFTDGRTDRQTDGQTTYCRIIHSAWQDEVTEIQNFY